MPDGQLQAEQPLAPSFGESQRCRPVLRFDQAKEPNELRVAAQRVEHRFLHHGRKTEEATIEGPLQE